MRLPKNLILIRQTNILKGFGILTVIFSHAGDASGGIFYNIPIIQNQKILYYFLTIGMNVFFFLSGYGLYKSFDKHGFKDYWYKKILKIMIPYWFIQIILFIYQVGLRKKSIEINSIILSIIGIAPNNVFDGTMWYISNLIFWYIVFYLCFKFIKNKIISVIIQLAIASVIIMVGSDIWKYGYQYQLAFPTGTLFAFIESKNGLRYINEKIKLLLFISITIAWNFLYWRFPFGDNILGIMLCYFAVDFSVKLVNISRNSRVIYIGLNVLEKIGTVSYMLYLIENYLIIRPTEKIIFLIDCYKYGIVLFLIFLIVGLCMATILTKLWRKIMKTMEWIK